jgi:hypothetical protein
VALGSSGAPPVSLGSPLHSSGRIQRRRGPPSWLCGNRQRRNPRPPESHFTTAWICSRPVRCCSKRAFVTGLFAAATFIAHLCANCRRCSDRTLMSCPISGKQWHAQSHSISQPTCSRAHPRCDDRALGAHARLAGIWVAAAWFSKIRPLRTAPETRRPIPGSQEETLSLTARRRRSGYM